MMYSSTSFEATDPTNPTENLLTYIIVKYVQQYSKFLDWGALKVDHQKFNELLTNKKTEILQKITPEIPILTDIMEIGFLRNVVVGDSSDPQSFYRKVMEASESNKRNSEEYKSHILKNLVGVIK